MSSMLFIFNDAPYGNERAYNALRLAAAVAAKEGQQVRVFLMADAVACAKGGQKVPEGYYNIQLMLGKIIRKGEVMLCGTCMDARGLRAEELMEGAQRGTLLQLADWTVASDKVLVF
ncbi:MAG: DsrE family protein [Rhodoferax sp.]|jgi:uncharacterized protein involved in oxidation of intracellular sulfur|uniref:DsrE/DsrF/TusD sulfur relay family protein n=1 Tax=Rhodoferax sp. TaxID=50421 RepID=UPI003BAE7A10